MRAPGGLLGGLLGLLLFPAAVAASDASPPAPDRPRLLVAHLPSAWSEPRELAAGVEALGSYLGREVPGLDLEVVLFRRWRDLEAFVARAGGRRIALVLADHLSLPDLASACELEPAFRFLRNGGETYHHLVVVHREGEAAQALEDLRGRSLSLVEVHGPRRLGALQHRVFDGVVVPHQWFEALLEEPDEHTATANVLFGRSDSALVAEHNPLLAEHLGRTLRQVYASPPLSLPVLGACHGGTTARQRRDLALALGRIGEREAGLRVLQTLGLDGLRPVPEEGFLSRHALRQAPSPRARELAVLAPPLRLSTAPRRPPLDPGDLTFWVPLERPLVEIPELEIETGVETPDPPP